MNPKILWTAGMVAALATTAVTAYWLGTRTVPTPAAVTASAEKAVLYWYDPMVPDQHFDKPGKSPFMDMDLVPKYAGADDAATIKVSAATLQNLGVRTAQVEVGSLASSLRVPGSIAWDRRASREVSARVDAIVDKLYVRATYTPVRKGQPLAELIAPAWNAAAQEYLALEALQSDDAQSLRSAARQRLRVLGMDDGQIRNLRGGNTGIVLHAPIDGVVGELMIREGQSVQAGMSLMTINGLDTVWAEAAIPQAQSNGVRPGMAVEARTSAYPGEVFAGSVESLLADINSVTRTQQARIVLDNPEHRLTPGMFVDLAFSAAGGATHPLIPDSALIATGSDARVIVETGQGRFAPVRVVAGHSAAGQTEILEGLDGGERVVVSGQFLIDSEASLSGALDRLSAPEAAAPMPHDMHEGHKMPANHDQHQGHKMTADQSGHEGHEMPAKVDPHAGHDMPEGHVMPKDPQP
ncbi:MAG TPA: efflux RND transporter periplasmic adaptor subunit [Dokdonella sp.]|uniref:efflux RND transporter periplasmic adaptor subunit n=1 Tax=Dokdonella sp. TaxID=2291710 RepID=UPI002D80050D|nr:efflux RND transporter periplasmic adaptor subunit [Dokdonella sp.]HET9034354.1 efflux RND transporter periplasmic adaptor subunit [Dokdonella sp.]